jgi:8-oxo-dGTP diphosphatase
MIQVVAAILERDGKILICRRRPEQSHGLQWEFPGGKVEAGETPEQALARELQEELGIAGAQGSQIAGYHYAYPGKNAIALFFFRVHSYSGEPQNLIFHEMRWESAATLGHFDFVEGDREFLRGMAAGVY